MTEKKDMTSAGPKRLVLKDRHRRLIAMVKANWVRLAFSMGCMLVMAGAASTTAFLVKPVLDDIFFKKDMTMLKFIPLVIIIVYFLNGLSRYGEEYLMNYVGESIIRELRDKLYDRIQDLSLAFFQEEKTGALMSRITNDVNIIKSMVSTAVTSSLRDIFTVVGLIFVIFYRDWKLALIATVILPFAYFPIVEFGRRTRKVSKGYQEAMAEMTSFLHETFAGNKIVKAFGMEAFEKDRFRKKTRRLFKLEMKTIKYRALTSPVMEILGGIGAALVIWYGGYKVIVGSSTPGTFFSFLAAVLMLYGPVKALAKINTQVQRGLAASDRVFDILEMESDIKEKENPVVIPDGNHRVVLKNVSFKYREDRVLKDINLTAHEGEIIALVGMSGGGKTTLVNLIPRFYDVTEGSVKVDDIDVRDATIASLRRQIAIVTQEPILFNDTIRNNIAYGCPEASMEGIENAAKAAYAYDFIQGFPGGFQTVIGELGGRLSGGEKQRLCIARALLKDAPILILDEATSSLDSEAESTVQKALENLMQGRTTFVIAHRLSTISYAHRIVVIVNGRIVEEGNQATLLSLNGEFYKLYQMQFGDKPFQQNGGPKGV
jgi:subfamily B ATP-binding cassette protein MsbA